MRSSFPPRLDRGLGMLTTSLVMILVMSSTAAGQCDVRIPADSEVSRALGAAVKNLGVVTSDRQTCEFVSAEHTRLYLSLRPGMGRVTIQSWIAGRMPLKALPLSGVGDRALWQPELNEVFADRGDLLCDITVVPPSAPPAPTKKNASSANAALAARLGALCNKVFASMR